ncbi:MAG: response regulator [Kiritimatiellae bacterium]|nr:response regulator [Kiritimatiellia bacterium]
MHSLKIFIVEDERIVALDLQNRLARLGHEIIGNFASAGETLERMKTLRPDLVLTDIKLGAGMDGIELARAVREQYGLPVVFATAYSDDQTLARVKASGACGFITKPFTDAELQATIEIGVHEHDLAAKLEQSERQYRRLFDDAPVGYHEIDLMGNLVRVNRAELEMLGYTAAEMIGRPVWEFLRESGPAREMIAGKLSKGKINPRPFETNYLRRDGVSLPVLEKDYSICSGNGEFLGILSTIQDLSLLKEEQAKRMSLEASLRRAEKLESLAAMAGGLAHELNNQLMAVQGNAALALLNQSPDAGEAREYLQNVLTACQRSTMVLKQLLVCAGMDKGEFSPVNLSEIAVDTVASLKELAAGNAKLHLRLEKNLPPINGNAAQLKQLFSILVANSLDAVRGKGGGTGGIIQIETGIVRRHKNGSNGEIILRAGPSAPGRRCYLSVTDNGHGMDAATRSKLFDPFFSTKGVGRGLGLSAALGIVKNHAGDIMVKTASDGGTTVRIVLPCVKTGRK